jgi:hypothetical protein
MIHLLKSNLRLDEQQTRVNISRSPIQNQIQGADASQISIK